MSVKKIDPEKIIKALHDQVDKYGMAGLRGLVRWGLLIQRGAMKGAPIVTGNLRASAFVVSGFNKAGGTTNATARGFKGKQAGWLGGERAMKTGGAQALCAASPNPFAYVGFTAFYAPYVEASEGAGRGVHKRGVPAYKQRSSVGGSHFLEFAVEINKEAGMQALKSELKKAGPK
jgi:hypothetical protein